LEKVAEECKAVATHPSFVPTVVICDVTDLSKTREAVETLPPIDILINNAGSGAWKHIERTTPEEGIEMMACPYNAAFTLTSLLIPSMIPRAKNCHIVNVTSATSQVGFQGAVGYGAARWAMRGFSRYLARDVKDLGIGVTLLNASEISDTAYFTNAPGKAGKESHNNIPTMFAIIPKLGLKLTSADVAVATIGAVEQGWKEVHVPGYLILGFKMVNDIAPDFAEFLISLGPNGSRSALSKTD